MSKKLWQTQDSPLSKIVEEYTVGCDYILDQELIYYDIKGSQAHIKMLHKMNVLTSLEFEELTQGLNDIQDLASKGELVITQTQEDGHTAIEQYLSEHYGDVGKKIHTGRSRNDQSAVMLRLYMKDKLLGIKSNIKHNITVIDNKVNHMPDYPMPGYTHMQKAMPTNVPSWISSFADALRDIVPLLDATINIIDQNPLGAASGFGISNFKHDREYTSQLLNFSRTQKNPIYCSFSRGYFEKLVLQTLSNPMNVYGKFANDMMLYTMSEFDYFSLPDEYTTGSSIMPQKRNYDLFEIMRGNTKIFQGYLQQISNIIDGLSSGYNRDCQLTKGPFMYAIRLIEKTMILFSECIKDLIVNEDKLDQAMTEDLYVTNKVYDLVNKGMSFRQAYHKIKSQL